jgi:pimeloyl-ACP methyl ester carboxylesterase
VRVFLLHGMARTVVSMAVLAHRLERAGHRPNLFGYHVLVQSLDEIAARFRDRVRRVVAGDGPGATFAIVGHSLGGVVARMAGPQLPPGLARLVLLASPARPPATALALEANPLFRHLARDAGRRLRDPAFFESLPRPQVPTLVIAGTRGPTSPRLPYAGAPNDGIVRVSETAIDGAEQLRVHGVHTFLMNRKDVFEAIQKFLTSPQESLRPDSPQAQEGGEEP